MQVHWESKREQIGVSLSEGLSIRGNRSQYDVAYGCFLFCGLATLSISAVMYAPIDEGLKVFLLFWASPLILASLVVMLIGIVLSVRLWRHWALLILSIMSVLYVAEMVFEYGSSAFYNAVPVVYGIGVVTICGVWFLILRGKRFPPPSDWLIG